MFIYNFLPNLPPCNKTVEMKCIFDLLVTYRKERYTCLNLKKNVQYHGNIFLNYISESNGTAGFKLYLYFDKFTKNVKEEILMVQTTDFIGSIGGSLGLFLGFSCFTYLSGMLDKLLS